MCRLLGYVSTAPTSVKDFSGFAFNEFVNLSNVHKDSWGLSLIDGERKAIFKSVESAASSGNFEKVVKENKSSGGLLHFRWASPGITVNEENAHPFIHEDFSFIHNGALQPYDALLGELTPEILKLRRGSGDSELFFLFTLAKVEQLGFKEGVLSAIATIKQKHKYSSINSMFLNSDFLIVISEHDPENRPSWTESNYYEVRYRLDESGCVVASSGWDQSGWVLMPNHSALIVDRRTMESELISL